MSTFSKDSTAVGLRTLRRLHQLRQNELASQLGISKSHLSGLESGDKAPSFALIQKYAEVFEMPLSSVMLIIERAASGEALPDGGAKALVSRKAVKLLELLAELSGQEAD